jgi:hypothetical protein
MASELVMEHLARELGTAPEALKELNMNREGDVMHYGQVGGLGAAVGEACLIEMPARCALQVWPGHTASCAAV